VPAITVPYGFTRDGLPAGLQIAGPWRGEAQVRRAVAAPQGRPPPGPTPARRHRPTLDQYFPPLECMIRRIAGSRSQRRQSPHVDVGDRVADGRRHPALHSSPVPGGGDHALARLGRLADPHGAGVGRARS